MFINRSVVEIVGVAVFFLLFFAGPRSASGEEAAPSPSSVFRLTQSFYHIREDIGSVTITVERSGAIDTPASVDVVTGGSWDSARKGVDYADASATLQFESGTVARDVIPMILDNSSIDGDRSFTVTLANPSEGAVVGGPDISYILIADDDPCGNGTIDEGEECETGNLGGRDCTSLGFEKGILGCTAACRFDTFGCSGGVAGVFGAESYETVWIGPEPAVVTEAAPEAEEAPLLTGGEPTSGSEEEAVVVTEEVTDSPVSPPTVQKVLFAPDGEETGGESMPAEDDGAAVKEEKADDETNTSTSGLGSKGDEDLGGGLGFIGELAGGGLRCTLVPSEAAGKGIVGEIVIAILTGLFYVARRQRTS